MPASEYNASSYDDFLAFVVRSVHKGTNYQLSTSITEGTRTNAGEITGCTRTYYFQANEKLIATYRQEQLRFDSDDKRQIDERQSLTDLIEDVTEYSSPRKYSFGAGATGRFFMKKDISIPQRAESPLNNRGELKGWLREYFQHNGRDEPDDFTSFRLEQLTEIYESESHKYGFSVEDIVPKIRK